MIKPDGLRAALSAAIPLFAGDPTALKMWIDKGGIVARSGPSLAFEYRYTLNLVVEGWQQHPSVIVLAINMWLAVNQPELLSGGRAPSYTFEADIIDNQTIDLAFELPLTEAVRVLPRPGGDGFDLTHVAEEDPIFPDAAPILPSAPTLQEIWWRGERLIPEPPLPDAP